MGQPPAIPSFGNLSFHCTVTSMSGSSQPLAHHLMGGSNVPHSGHSFCYDLCCMHNFDACAATATTDKPTAFPMADPTATGTLNDICFNGSNEVIVGDDGTIARSTDNGATWSYYRTNSPKMRRRVGKASARDTSARRDRWEGRQITGIPTGHGRAPFAAAHTTL